MPAPAVPVTPPHFSYFRTAGLYGNRNKHIAAVDGRVPLNSRFWKKAFQATRFPGPGVLTSVEYPHHQPLQRAGLLNFQGPLTSIPVRHRHP